MTFGYGTMNPEEFRLLKEFIGERYGITLDEGKAAFLSGKIFPRVRELGLSTMYDYYAYLKYSPQGPVELRSFIPLITNNETYFFREEPQLQVFSREILPLLKQEKVASGDRKLRIVSAGCSSGEEAYTLAMLVLESAAFLWDWDISIIGVDIDETVLARAREGMYSGRAFQAMPDGLLEKYFRKNGDSHVVKDLLKKIVSFRHGNLLEFADPIRGERPDVIFCRNVLIYFSDETIKKIIEGFAASQPKEGHLFLGHSESLTRITSRYLPVRYPGAIIYKLRELS